MNVLRAPGILCRAAALVAIAAASAAAQSRDLSTYSLLARDQLRANGLRVVSGDVGVNDGMAFARRALLAPTSPLVADTIRISPESTCAALFGNSIFSTGPACGPAVPFAPPILPDVPAACGYPASFPDCGNGPPIVVGRGQTLALGPGAYSDILVAGRTGDHGRLVLTGGDYFLCSLRTYKTATLVFEDAARVHVRGELRLGNGSVTGPAAGAPIAAGDVLFLVGGSRARVAHNARVEARICAPEATLSLAHGSVLSGQYVARVIRAGRAVVTRATPGGGPTTTTTPTTTTSTSTSASSTTSTTTSGAICGDALVGPGEQCDPPGSLVCPAGSPAGAFLGCLAGCQCPLPSTTTTLPPGVLGVEICGNCVDDDANGQTDFEDPACCPQGRSAVLSLRRARIRAEGPGVSRLRLRTRAALPSVNPLREDVFLQIRPENGTDMLCAQIPAARFRRVRKAFRFRDRSSLVASARGLERMRIKVKRDGTLRLRTRGRHVQMVSPAAGRLQVTFGFRDVAKGDAGNMCSTVTAAFRTKRRGLKAP